MAKRPSKKADAKTTRYQIRCPVSDLKAWEDRAAELGYASASAWLQKVANEALKHPLPKSL